MVAQALEPDWALCADDWGACDLKQVGGPLRIQVKQSTARQSWHNDNSQSSRPSFSIKYKTGRHEGLAWVTERSRNAEIFVFGWHPVTDSTADHRDPAQWLFYVTPERDLPAQDSIGLAGLQRLGDPVGIEELPNAVAHIAQTPLPRT